MFVFILWQFLILLVALTAYLLTLRIPLCRQEAICLAFCASINQFSLVQRERVRLVCESVPSMGGISGQSSCSRPSGLAGQVTGSIPVCTAGPLVQALARILREKKKKGRKRRGRRQRGKGNTDNQFHGRPAWSRTIGGHLGGC